MESLLAVDSIMEDTSLTGRTKRRNVAGSENKLLKADNKNGGDVDEEECDSEAWETLSKSFCEVQTVLDRNRALIQQVNENHQSKIPENLAKNVALIREINGNISKVSSLYSNLSVDFVNAVQLRRGGGAPSSKMSNSNSND